MDGWMGVRDVVFRVGRRGGGGGSGWVVEQQQQVSMSAYSTL
jgi:hypothetical protein